MGKIADIDDIDGSISDNWGYANSRFSGSIYDSVNGWASGQDLAVYACGALQTVSSIAATATGVGGPVGLGVSVITGAVTNGIAAYNTQKVVAGLKQVLEDPAVKANSGDAQTLREIVGYCIQKRSSQFGRQIASAAAVGSGVSLFQNVKGIYKAARHTKGKNRVNHSKTLYEMSKKNDAVGTQAKRVIALLCGGSFDDLMQKAISDGMKSSV